MKGHCVHATDTADVVARCDVVQRRSAHLPIPFERATGFTPLLDLTVGIHRLCACQGMTLIIGSTVHQVQPPFYLLVARPLDALAAFPMRFEQRADFIG